MKAGAIHNTSKRRATVTTAVPTAKGIRSTQQNYNSNITIRLWPFTCMAIKEYMDGERDDVLCQRLKNRSKSFLFLAGHGGPFEDRTSIARVFTRLREGLMKRGLLNNADGDPFTRGAHYEFSAYTLRHSAATLFYSMNQNQPDVKDQMRVRFGWSDKSTSPDLYAKRAMSEAASIDMIEFHETLLHELASKRDQRRRADTPEE